MTRCDCSLRRIAAAQLAALPERFRGSTLENYIPIDAQQEQALARVQAGLTGGLFLFGGYGRGKTHLAAAQYKALIFAGQSCAWRTMPGLLAELRSVAASGRGEDHDRISLVLNRAKHADSFHLFIDDLDKYKPTEWTNSEALHELFDLIYARRLGVTVTSNYGMEALRDEGKISNSVFRRLDELCVAVRV